MDSKITYEEARKMAEDAKELFSLRLIAIKSKDLIGDILLSNPTPTMLFAFSGRISYANPKWLKATGYKQSDIKGKKINGFIANEHLNITVEAMGYASKGIHPRHFINKFRFADGLYHWVLWHPQRPANDEEYGVAFMSVLDDIPIKVKAGFVGDPYKVETKTWIKEKGSGS